MLLEAVFGPMEDLTEIHPFARGIEISGADTQILITSSKAAPVKSIRSSLMSLSLATMESRPFLADDAISWVTELPPNMLVADLLFWFG